jgi:dTDP-4-dehydrorhamnose reductase
MRRIAVIGPNGQLGSALCRQLGEAAIRFEHDALDITQPAQVEAALDAARPEVVINTAAYNWVDKAEDEPLAAYELNALGPRHLALACRKRDVVLVHISSDYVFGLDAARRTPYRETDCPGPQSAYAISKLAGEQFVRSHCPQSFVVRTCGLYGHAISAGKGNFVKTMLRLGAERSEVSIVDDQWCTPSSTTDVAAAIIALMATDRHGLYHATNSGGTTWARLAAEVFRVTGMTTRVKPITTHEFNAKAPRPAYSVLDCGQLAEVTGQTLPPWEEAVAAYVRELRSGTE